MKKTATPRFVEVTVKVPVKDVAEVVKAAGGMITRADLYKAMAKAKRAIASDLLSVWNDTNVDSDPFDVLAGLFGDKFMDKHVHSQEEGDESELREDRGTMRGLR